MALEDTAVDAKVLRVFLAHAFGCNKWFTFNGYVLDADTRVLTGDKEYLAPNFKLGSIPHVYMALPVVLE